jgi:hypothetical protein
MPNFCAALAILVTYCQKLQHLSISIAWTNNHIELAHGSMEQRITSIFKKSDIIFVSQVSISNKKKTIHLKDRFSLMDRLKLPATFTLSLLFIY